MRDPGTFLLALIQAGMTCHHFAYIMMLFAAPHQTLSLSLPLSFSLGWKDKLFAKLDIEKWRMWFLGWFDGWSNAIRQWSSPPTPPAAEQYKNCFAGRRRRVLAREERRYPRDIYCFLMVMAYAMLMIKFSFSHSTFYYWHWNNKKRLIIL